MSIASGPIDEVDLSQADIFVAAHRQTGLTADELSALTAFAGNGGGIICVGLGWSWLQGTGHTFDNYPMNSIAGLFDMRYVDGWINDATNNIDGDRWHPIFHTFLPLQDEDEDGFTADVDCDDNDSSVYPGAPELCDGKINNCGGTLPADEVDVDGDGFMICDNDCNDMDPAINPDAYELPGDTVDDNCDGTLGACDPGVEWNNHGQFVRCVAHETDALIEAGYLTEQEGDELISSAAQSDIGKK